MVNIRYALLLSFVLIFGCNNKTSKYSQQFKVIDELLYNLSKNDTSAVRKMIGAKNLKDIGRDEHGLNFKIKETSELIALFGFPNRNKYILTEYPENAPELLDIEMPLFDGKSGSLRKAVITVKFVKYLPKDKILDFDLSQEYQKTDINSVDSVRNF